MFLQWRPVKIDGYINIREIMWKRRERRDRRDFADYLWLDSEEERRHRRFYGLRDPEDVFQLRKLFMDEPYEVEEVW